MSPSSGVTSAAIASRDASETANDRFKRRSGIWFWLAILVATGLHSVLLAAWPAMEAAPTTFTMREIEAVELPPTIDIPPPPEAIARPANPVVVATTIDANVTISPTTFDRNPMDALPPAPAPVQVDISSQPTFTPYTVAPEVRNRREVEEALRREYPSILRDNGIGGRVLIHFFIDANGDLEDVRIAESSGLVELDQAALRVAEVFEFTPALNRDERVPVWIQIPITFRTS